jgi:hypothetical protein
MAKPWDGTIESIPYPTSTTTLVSHYQRRGARHVHVKWISDADLAHMITAVSPLFTSQLPTRLNSNIKMLWLRHVVFSMSQTHGVEYDGYTYWREDNLFYSPLEEGLFPSSLGAKVLVDKWCGFGSYSDKIYVANLAGANLLFDRSSEQFQQKMQVWVHYAKRKHHEFQTESLLGHVLSAATVKKVDFKRSDVRYVNNIFCRPHMYSQCGSVNWSIPICSRAE